MSKSGIYNLRAHVTGPTHYRTTLSKQKCLDRALSFFVLGILDPDHVGQLTMSESGMYIYLSSVTGSTQCRTTLSKQKYLDRVLTFSGSEYRTRTMWDN